MGRGRWAFELDGYYYYFDKLISGRSYDCLEMYRGIPYQSDVLEFILVSGLCNTESPTSDSS